jgi:hypothetical protein
MLHLAEWSRVPLPLLERKEPHDGEFFSPFNGIALGYQFEQTPSTGPVNASAVLSANDW